MTATVERPSKPIAARWLPLVAFLGALAGCTPFQPGMPGGSAESDPGQAVLQAAQSRIGAPYRYGGAGPDAFDCSGLVTYVHRQLGIDVPRMRRAMDSPEITALLEQNRAHAIDVSDNPATPLFVINGELVPGFNQPLLDERLREATRNAREQREARR